MMTHSNVHSVQGVPLSAFGTQGLEYIVRWRVAVPTCATLHIVRGNPSAPFSGATFIHYGENYRPIPAGVYTLRSLPQGHGIF